MTCCAPGQELEDTILSFRVLMSVGDAAFANRDFTEAERLYRRALVLAEMVIGREDAEVAGLLNKIADLCLHQGKGFEAEKIYEQALLTVERTLGPNRLPVAIILRNLAELIEKKGDDDTACRLRARAATILQQHRTTAHDLPCLTDEMRQIAYTSNPATLYVGKLE